MRYLVRLNKSDRLAATVLVQTSHRLGNQNIFLNTIAAAVDHQPRWTSLAVLLACYTHLKCNREPYPSCLRWSNICDKKIDCLDDGYTEEHYWQTEIHQCNLIFPLKFFEYLI
jgi:hypothetical protein